MGPQSSIMFNLLLLLGLPLALGMPVYCAAFCRANHAVVQAFRIAGL